MRPLLPLPILMPHADREAAAVAAALLPLQDKSRWYTFNLDAAIRVGRRKKNFSNCGNGMECQHLGYPWLEF